jgi:PHD/YefM family antitoxin component YafN of YafNO toxin-antitoxin module
MMTKKTIAASRRRVEERLEVLLSALPPQKLRQIADYAEYLKSREEWEATRELLSDPGMRKDVEEGRAQAKRGNGARWRDIQRRVHR